MDLLRKLGEIGYPGVEVHIRWPKHRKCEIFTCLDPKEMRNDEKINSLFAILFLSRYLVGSLNPFFISLSHLGLIEQVLLFSIVFTLLLMGD